MHARGLRPRRVQSHARDFRIRRCCLPHLRYCVGTLISEHFAARWLPTCTPVNASRAALRLPRMISGPVGSLFLTVRLFHSLLRAGLSRRTPNLYRAPSQGSIQG